MGLSTAVLLLTTISLLSLPTQSARILAIEPFPCKSHVLVFSALTKELARRGHEMVVVTPFPSSTPIANYTEIDTMEAMRAQHEKMVGKQLYAMHESGVLSQPFVVSGMGLETSENLFRVPEVQALLEDKRGFDLVIVETFMNEAVYGFADYFKAPLVLVAPFGGFHFFNYGPGNPIPFSYVPNPVLGYSDRMSFTQRLTNTIFTLVWDLGNQFYYLPRQEAIRSKVFKNGKNVWELQRSVSLTLLNNHFSLNYPRPLVPSVIEVGGMHVMQKNNKLPKDIQSFLDGAKEGAIYFSMGSNLRSDLMPVETREMIMTAFSELPQRILWKWESDMLPGQPSNVKVLKWLPQQDILAHPNLRLFITHGGLLSIQEAIHQGVPFVGIPVYGDQSLNMRKAELGGYGLTLDLKNVTKTSVLWAVNKVINDPNYRHEAQRRSGIYRDQSETPLERAAFWTEYVLRHKGAHHLRTAATRLSFYQLYLLDVVAVILAALVLVFLVSRALLKLVCRTTNVPNKIKKN
ncbi:UDP-glycosyltransferase-09 [Ephemera danica]|nr:UDP-glycosyltransferase-09 [Ephemera danica]